MRANGGSGRGAVVDPDSSRGPVFITEPPDRVDFSNSTGAIVECSAHGNPLPIVHWSLMNGSSVNDVKNIRHILPNGSLHFPSFRANLYQQDVHAGRYQCIASSPLGVIRSRPVHVRAVVQQYYEVQVYDEFVIIGNTAVLKCHIPPFVKEYVQVEAWIRNKHLPIQSGVLSGK
uniref:Ig-like domain-containing protein n=1 Tax=Strigamia maritima TaxID=126957 RepID=T1JCP5_STRMM